MSTSKSDTNILLFVETLPNGGEILALRDKEVQRIYNVMNEDSEQAITDAKYGFITGALKETFTDNHMEKEQTTRVIDSIVTHRIWGYPIFFLFLYIMFEGTFVLGDYRYHWRGRRSYRILAQYSYSVFLHICYGGFRIYGTCCIYYG